MSWDTGFDRCDKLVEDKCPELTEDSPKPIKLNIQVFGKIVELLKTYPKLEWGVYMIGEETEEAYEIEDILLMRQEVTAGTVEFLEEREFPDKCIGWLHSHAISEVFLSEADLKTALLYKLTVVVNNEFKFLSKFKKTLSCGKVGLIDTGLIINGIEIDTSNITEKTYFEYKTKVNYNSVKRIEVKDKKKQCVVCGQKLGKKKKQTLCPLCGNMVHLRCFSHEYQQCLNCVNDLKEELIKEGELFNDKEYKEDYDEDEDGNSLSSYRSDDYYERGHVPPHEDY